MPLRWLVIMLLAGLAAFVSYPLAGAAGAILAAAAVATALHTFLD